MDETVGIYVHIPFCASKCGYCDFYSRPDSDQMMDKYQQALLTHIQESLPRMQPYYIDTVYFGGGTPSYYGAKRLCEVLDALKASNRLLKDAEITAEMNPDSMRLNDLKLMRKEGFNRISMGVQSANDKILKLIGRRHTYEQAVKAYRMARQAGFKNISVDLIYGLPGQTKADWADTLAKIIGWNPDHISCYGLKLEEGTPMYQVYHDTNAIPDDDTQADMYLYASEMLERHGYHRYEISNFARRGMESQHNLKYWQLHDYMGFGPSAHSCVGNQRYSYVPNLQSYITGVLTGGEIIDEHETITELERANEYLMLSMRTAYGISARDYTSHFRASFAPLEEKLKFFAEKGWAKESNGRWAFTTSGFLVSNLLIGELLDVQAEQNAVGNPYLQEILDNVQRQSLPESDDETFLRELFGMKDKG